jgi:uncharacterized protein (DUF305 family)
MRHRRGLIAVIVGIVLAVTGCANNDKGQTVPSNKPYNDADVDFATNMIQHHAQALTMVDHTIGRDLDPDVAALAEEIRTRQTPEIQQMVGLLNSWDHQPIPETSRDHANAHGGDGAEMNADLPGMLTSGEVQGLEDASDPEVQSMWLDMMIEHHQGAIEMASAEQNDGKDEAATTLAAEIVKTQKAQVRTMQGLLDG